MNKKYNYKDVFVHETSFIDENVIIEEGTKIWHFNHILKNCKKEWCNVTTDNYTGWIKTTHVWGSTK